MSKGFDADVHLTSSVIQAAKSAGFIGAGRYTKNLTMTEVDLCRQHGFGLWLISEGMGDLAAMQRGQAGGLMDGQKAAAQANQLGAPTTVPIAAAVDFDAATPSNLAAVDAYMTGFATGIAPRPLLVYGDGAVLTSHLPVGTRAYVAGAGGWAGTKDYLAKNKAPALVQHQDTTMFGIDLDLVDVNDESVLWFPAEVALPVATPAPTTVVTTTVTTVATKSVMPSLKDLQQAVGVTADGIYGPDTAAAVERYYTQ